MATSLRAGVLYYAGAMMFDRLLGLLLLPLLTRSLTPGDYGAWTQTLLVAGLLLPWVLWASPTGIVRWFSSAAAQSRAWPVFCRLLGVAALLWLGLALTGLLTRGDLAVLLYGEARHASLLGGFLLLLLADSLTDFATSWLRARGRLDWVAGLLGLRSLLRLGSVLMLGGTPGGLAQWLTAYAALQLALAGVATGLVALGLRRLADPAAPAPLLPNLRDWVRFGAELVILATLTAALATFDRFWLVQLAGLDAVARYAATASLAGIPAVLHAVLGFTLFPVLARHWAAQRIDEAARLTVLALRIFLTLALPLSLGLVLVGPDLLAWLGTAHYRVEHGLFLGLGLATLGQGIYQVLLYGLLLDNRSRQVLGLVALAAALNAGLNALAVPRAGLLGAALAAASSQLLLGACAWRLLARRVPLRWPAGAGRALLLPLLGLALPPTLALGWGGSLPLLLAAACAGGLLYLLLAWRAPGSVLRELWSQSPAL